MTLALLVLCAWLLCAYWRAESARRRAHERVEQLEREAEERKRFERLSGTMVSGSRAWWMVGH